MDLNKVDEERYVPIRQTIRRVILPLVQAIYDENPADIISFCSRYFEDQQLQGRENKDNVIEGGSVGFTHDKCVLGATDIETTESIPTTLIQGSSSDPILTGDRRRESFNLRETSSWDMPPGQAKSDGTRATQNCDLADAVSGIGDQLDAEAKSSPSDLYETDAKSGDAGLILKDEEKMFGSSGPQANNIKASIATDPIAKAVISPSAPPYEENDKNLTENFGDCSLTKGEKPDINSKSLLNVVSDSCSEDVKRNIKPLSPNSSFGFIPHLNEYNSESDSTIAASELSGDLSYQEKSPSGIQELSLKFSERLKNLAKTFNLAENNLNAEFQRSKEISDIIKGRCQTESSNEGVNLGLDYKISDDNTFEGNDEPSYGGDNLNNVSYSKNILTKKSSANNFSSGNIESTDETKGKVRDNEKSRNDIKYNYSSLETHYRTEDSNLNLQSSVSQDSELYEGKRNVNQHQSYSDNDESGMNNFGYRPVVDETWRKRWYEVHPCLDSIGRNFQQATPRLMRTKRIFTGSRRNLTANNIGEAGDVSSGIRYHLPEGILDGITNNDPSAAFKHASEIDLPAEEITKGNNASSETKVTSCVFERSLTTSDSDAVSSKSEPHFRGKTNEMVNYLEAKSHTLKQLLETLGERNDKSENTSSDSSEGILTSHEQENLSEIVVVKESDECKKDDLTRNEYCETIDNFENFRKNANEKTELSPLKSSGDCETNLIGGTMISESNDQDLNEEEVCIEEYVDVVEVQEQSYPESGDTRSSDIKYHSKEKNFASSCFTDDGNEIPVHLKSEKRGSMGKTAGNKDASATKSDEDNCKVEPGLNSACGDFTSFNNASQVEDSQYHNLSDSGVQEITAECVESILERVMQQQNTSDSFEESLNFSCFSGSESSNIESDLSEDEDTSLNNGM